MGTWPRVILFGDSLTQHGYEGLGWAVRISSLLQRKCDVMNRGYSGYNTNFAVKVLDKALDQSLLQNVAAITIFFGANDASLEDMNKWQHVPLNDYEDNLKKMIKHCVDHGVSKEKIIFISPPPVDEALWLIKMKEMGLPYDTSDRKLKVTEKYAEVCKKVANTAGCKYIDLWSALMNTADLKKYLSDGLHLNDTGSLLLADCITPVIQELTSHLPMQLPAWDVFDL